MTNVEKIRSLMNKTDCGFMICGKAIDYAKDNEDLAIAYIKAKTMAVATHSLSFDERVQKFYKIMKGGV